MKRGLFITFEGVEGCGKSTQIVLLQKFLQERGRDAMILREPGGTKIGEAIRQILLDTKNHEMAPATELMLYEAARAQIVAEKIRPALEAGVIVLCDRFYDSTTAYQGGGRGFSVDVLRALNMLATANLSPDLTILLDVPVALGLQRAASHKQADRLEQETVAFHERVRDAFFKIADENPERVKTVDGTGPVDAVAAEIRKLVGALI